MRFLLKSCSRQLLFSWSKLLKIRFTQVKLSNNVKAVLNDTSSVGRLYLLICFHDALYIFHMHIWPDSPPFCISQDSASGHKQALYRFPFKYLTWVTLLKLGKHLQWEQHNQPRIISLQPSRKSALTASRQRLSHCTWVASIH